MTSPHPRGRWLLAVGLFALALPARAADFDKYLLDDADAVLTINVKQARESALYTKHAQKSFDKVLQLEPVQNVLKGTGFDPIKDIDRLTLVDAPSCHPPEGVYKGGDVIPEGSPCFIVQGNLDQAKLKAFVEGFAKVTGKKVKEDKAGNAPFLELVLGRDSLFFALPEKGTVVFSARKDHVTAALEKGAGMKKPALKNKALQDLLAKFDPKATASWAATEVMITGSSLNSTKGDKSTTVKHHTMGERGFTAVTGSATVAEDVKGQTAFVSKDADRAKELVDSMEKSLESSIAGLTKITKEKKEFVPLIEVMKSIKVSAKDKTVMIEGHAKGEAAGPAIDAIVTWLFLNVSPPSK